MSLHTTAVELFRKSENHVNPYSLGTGARRTETALNEHRPGDRGSASAYNNDPTSGYSSRPRGSLDMDHTERLHDYRPRNRATYSKRGSRSNINNSSPTDRWSSAPVTLEEPHFVERPRTESRDSLVKLASDRAKFEDVRSVAYESWKQGVDLELANISATEKKKDGWMTTAEFENYKPQQTHKTQFDTDHSKHYDKPNGRWTLTKPAAANATPGWSPEEEVVATSNHSLPLTTAPGTILPSLQNSHSSHPFPSYATAAAAAATAASSPAIVPQVPLINPIYDAKTYRELYAVSVNLYGPQTVTRMVQLMELIIQDCRVLSHRTFGMLIRVLASKYKAERQDLSREFNSISAVASSLIITNWRTFYSAVMSYIHIAVLTPLEMIPLLELFAMIHAMCPYHDGIPYMLLERRLSEIKATFDSKRLAEASELLLEVRGQNTSRLSVEGTENTLSAAKEWQNSGNDTTGWVDDWSKEKIPIPRILEADEILQEVAAGLSVLNRRRRKSYYPTLNYTYRRDRPIDRLTNIMNEPYVDIDMYLMVHYVLLHEEVFGPLIYAIQSYFSGASAQTGDGWKIHRYCSVFCSTFLPTFSDPIVVFEITSPTGSEINHSLEGSIAVLIPEASAVNEDQQLPDLNEILSRGSALKGTIACARTHHNGVSTIGVHFDHKGVNNIDWSIKYTIFSSDANAFAALPVLEWFWHQYNHLEDSKLSPATTSSLLCPGQKQKRESTPDYLRQLELSIGNIMAPEYKNARLHIGVSNDTTHWPGHSKDQIPFLFSQKSSMYALSPTQLKAIQHALTHPVSIISGMEGTGKTFLASKIIELAHQALISGQCFQPILVLTKNESTLDDILGRIINTIPDLIRLGQSPSVEALANRQAVVVAAPHATDPDRKFIDGQEKKMAFWQSQLSALWQYRWKLQEGDPTVMVTTIPPQIKDFMMRTCASVTGQKVTELTTESMWKIWMDASKPYKAPPRPSSTLSKGFVYRSLTSNAFACTGDRAMHIMDKRWYKERKQWIERHTPVVNSLADASHWPFTSSFSSYETRKNMASIWMRYRKEDLWNLPLKDKEQLCQDIIRSLQHTIDTNIKSLINEQMKSSKLVEEARHKKWLGICRFSRVIGMTADFAAANHELISGLLPKVVIVDEAHSILESIVSSFILCSRVEHVVMLGDIDTGELPTVYNATLRGEPKNLDVSLPERWKLSKGDVVRLEEQWRMCTDIAHVHYSALAPADKKFLPRPSSANENFADRSLVALKGLHQRTLFIDLQTNDAQKEKETDQYYSQLLNANVTTADLDEARFVCHLALYLYQQNHKGAQACILVFSPLQKALLQVLMREHIPLQSVFANKISAWVDIQLIDDYVGKESAFVILSLSMPCRTPLPSASISLALSRAKSGLYIVGDTRLLEGSPWGRVVRNMKERDLVKSRISVQCEIHHNGTISLGHWKDFVAHVKNGGCMEPCATLLDCGHVCEEACHHIRHSKLNNNCKKPCEQPRSCEHPCPNMCYQCQNKPCPPCNIYDTIVLPCGHTASGRCSDLTANTKRQCKVPTDYKLPRCGHHVVVPCHIRTSSEENIKCEMTVTEKLNCGHYASGLCGSTLVCNEQCSKRLECGHPCPQTVSMTWETMFNRMLARTSNLGI
ncbi:hypothetical protein BX666DRAFT_772283 [Dichotomocladium elegans]|nr:hypothetical protein BX666DRAFT_772283 [Dichotomocladium elegans]